MLVYSLGHTAARDTKTGTLFVKSINDVFRARAGAEDITTLMTRVNLVIQRHLEAWASQEFFQRGAKPRGLAKWPFSRAKGTSKNFCDFFGFLD